MRTRSLGLTVGVALIVAALVACSSKPEAPPRGDLLAQLQKEAEALKAENDGKDADIGVKATWAIKSVDVAEQPENDEAPWRGTITFTIRSETSDADGNAEVHEFDKDFAYTYNPTIQKWVFEYR